MLVLRLKISKFLRNKSMLLPSQFSVQFCELQQQQNRMKLIKKNPIAEL